MIEQINLSELFIETHNEIYNKHKNYNNNCGNKKYYAQNIFLELFTFVNTSCYWTRFNFDFDKNVYKEACISGKYLNEIHLFLSRHTFYDTLYKKLIDKYLILTNYETLDTVSQDSMFVRNILGLDCKRNPQYYNKPGLKIHSIVDSLRTPISFDISDCTSHDSHFIDNLLQNKFIDDDIFYSNCHTFLADSAYNTDLNMYNLTNKGLDVIFGRNKQHIKKGTIISKALSKHRKDYKKRGIVENFYGNIERYPSIINVYEKTIESYKGLVTFVACIMLAKKINKIIAEKNNTTNKEKTKADILHKKENAIKRKEEKLLRQTKQRKIKEEEDEQRKEINKKNNERINNIIIEKIDKKILKRGYNKQKKEYDKNRNNKKIKKTLSYDNYVKKIMEIIINHIRTNVLTCTETFEFAGKPAYITIIEKYAFRENTIKNKIKIAINKIKEDVINKFAKTFFDG